jgi:hypothetical protein
MGLEEAEGLLVRKIGGVLMRGKGQQQGQAGGTGGVWDEKIPGAIGGGFGGMLGKLGKLGLPAVQARRQLGRDRAHRNARERQHHRHTDNR